MLHSRWRPGRAFLAVLATLAPLALLTAPVSAIARGTSDRTTPARRLASEGSGPFAHLPRVPSFALSSTSIRNGRPLPKPQLSKLFKGFMVPGAKDLSPQLSWSHYPAKAKSFAITMYDPEAPILGGAIQWAVVNIPASTHTLAAGAGSPHTRLLPHGASEVVNDFGLPRYIGGAPQPGTGVHDFYFTVSALDVARLPVSTRTSISVFDLDLYEHTIARASIVCPTSAS